MARKRRTYTAEFKADAVRLYEQGNRTQTEIARDLDVPQSVLQGWIQRAAGAPRRVDPEGGMHQDALPKTADEQQREILRLRAEVKRLERNEDILKKAVAFFAKEKT